MLYTLRYVLPYVGSPFFILRLCGRSVDVLKLVRRNYGRDGLKGYREVEKFSKKVTKIILDSEFYIGIK